MFEFAQCCCKVGSEGTEFHAKKGPRCHRQRLNSKAESDPTFIKRIITGDETLVYEYDTQSRHQASAWKASNETRPKKPHRFQSKKKAMLTVFMDYKGIVHHEYLPEGQTVNKEYYLGVMRCLREAVRQKRKVCGQTIRGFCTIIMHRRTVSSLSMNF